MTTEHRKSPRRKVVEIQRTGGWGNVEYRHLLECGHTEIRPRAATAPKLACVWCLRAEEKERELLELTPPPQEILPETIDFADQLSENEIKVAVVTATLAKRFGVPVEAITMSVRWRGGVPSIQEAVVFLSAEDVARLTRGGT